jgi:hypothetical protein
MRSKETSFSKLNVDEACTHLRIWHCKFKSLSDPARLSNLEELVIAGFPDSAFDFAQGLKKLRLLRIVHLPKVSDLTGLEPFTSLRTLSLETCKKLKSAQFTKYAESEVSRFYSATGVANERVPASSFD